MIPNPEAARLKARRDMTANAVRAAGTGCQRAELMPEKVRRRQRRRRQQDANLRHVLRSPAGPQDVAQIVAKVADSLLAAGALAVTSTLPRESPADRAPAWQPHLVSRAEVELPR
jgi:hypothetical protein